ncbi:hypothetical protein Fuma_02273 [Fuerstiella marisgermanici]|uniref:Uncharacterized protein n=1 Tax=Fuerstiella marisgermanici TaxID=1891926 RepID=A0A1P8WF13_9PLAN|nr:hypothetical protein Fuma_02273 [Fuerstiella marisgermanici]
MHVVSLQSHSAGCADGPPPNIAALVRPLPCLRLGGEGCSGPPIDGHAIFHDRRKSCDYRIWFCKPRTSANLITALFFVSGGIQPAQ